MRVDDFIWVDRYVEKIEVKHNVTPAEIKEVFAGNPQYKKVRRGYFQGEDVYRALGQTDAGRYLIVFFIHKLSQEALILSARDMDRKERREYAR